VSAATGVSGPYRGDDPGQTIHVPVTARTSCGRTAGSVTSGVVQC